MNSSQTTQDTTVDAAQDAQLSAPAGLNLLGDTDAGGCCGGGSCAMPDA